ncbi:hypothetical protein P4909_11505 [Escherichia coli]
MIITLTARLLFRPLFFNGIAYDDPGSGNNPGGTRYTGYGFEVRKNGVLIASRETKGAIPGSYSAVIDMPSGRGSVTLEFKIFQKGNQGGRQYHRLYGDCDQKSRFRHQYSLKYL